MIHRTVYLFVPLLILQLTSAAQNSIVRNGQTDAAYVRSYHAGAYEYLVSSLKDEQNRSTTNDFLYQISALKLAVAGPDKLHRLVASYPDHKWSNEANFTLAAYYFEAKDWEESNDYVTQVSISALTKSDQSYAYFMQGYFFLSKKAYDQSFQSLQKVTIGPKIDAKKLAYYKGFVSYHKGLYDDAINHFIQAKEDEEFGASAKYFLAKMQLDEGKYEEVIQLAQAELSEDQTETNAAFYQLIGEAYAALNEPNKAANYFEKAIALSPNQPSAALYYQAGITWFKIGSKEEAIDYLQNAGLRSGAYAKLSAFQLGRIYVSAGDLENGLAAYTEAASAEDPEIREESLFHAGKLLINLENYSEGIRYLQDYEKEFSSGVWLSETQELLAEAYVRTSNYDQAIAYLQGLDLSSSALQKNYQRVTFQKASLMYQDLMNEESLRWFEESLRYPADAALANESYYYIGELHFAEGRYELAIAAYEKQDVRSTQSFYGLAYAHYNLFQYEQATTHFERFLTTETNEKLRTDARQRLADCYLAQKNYKKSLQLYQQVNDRHPSDYLSFQIGRVQKGLGEEVAAIRSFQKVNDYDDSPLRDDAVFEIAQLYFVGAEFSSAASNYTALIQRFPTSELLPEAYLNRAVCRTNLGNAEGAINDYELVLANYITAPKAFDAILGLQALRENGQKVEQLDALIREYKKANPDSKNLEIVEFEAAKSQYFNLNYASAISSLQRFLKDYPESAYTTEGRFYLADSYYRTEQLEEALKVFEQLRKNPGAYEARVVARLGLIYTTLGSYDLSIQSYQSLLSLNLSPKENYRARVGLMNAYYAQEDYSNSLYWAEEIISNAYQPINAARNATMLKAKSLQFLQRSAEARTALEGLVADADQIGAEAGFLLAQMDFEEGNYEASLTRLFDVTSRFASYTEWMDRSYLLIAKNYLGKGEDFQAKATLRSIIEHSQNEQVLNESQALLLQIEQTIPSDTTTIEEGGNK